MLNNIAILDIGKSNAKFNLVDRDNGELLFTDSVATRICNEPYYPHLDTDFLWSWYIAALQMVQQQYGVGTLCVTAHGATAALIDDQALVLPILDYEYSGPDELSDIYDQRCDAFEVTFSPKLPAGLNVGRQLFWLRHQFPVQFAKAHHILPYAQYWSWRLTGKAVSEITSIGSHTDLWKPLSRSFSEFAQREGFAQLLPEFMSSDTVLGKLKPELCISTGIGKECDVLVGIHDSNASLLPYLKTRSSPFTVMSTGTWVIIFAVGAELHRMNPERDCAANVNIYGDPIACGRFMGGREFAMVAGDDNEVGTNADLKRVIDEYIFALPAFSEIGGAYPDRIGQITTERALLPQERYALASLYCALLSDVSLGLCHSQGDIIVEGAYAHNAMLLTCLQAFRADQRVLVSSDNTGTTKGAAMLVARNCPPPQLQVVSLPSQALQESLAAYRVRWQELSDT